MDLALELTVELRAQVEPWELVLLAVENLQVH
jgi:hypothetical protein